MVRYAYFGIQRISAFLICKFSYFMSFESAIFVKPFLFNTVRYSAPASNDCSF